MDLFLNAVWSKYRSVSSNTFNYIMSYLDTVMYFQDLQIGQKFIHLIVDLKDRLSNNKEIDFAHMHINNLDINQIRRITDTTLYVDQKVLLLQLKQMEKFITRYFTMTTNSFYFVSKPLEDVVYEITFPTRITNFDIWMQFCDQENVLYTYYDMGTISKFVIFATDFKEKINQFLLDNKIENVTIGLHDNVLVYVSGKYLRLEKTYEIDCFALDINSILQSFASHLPLLQIIRSIIYGELSRLSEKFEHKIEYVKFTTENLLDWFDDHKKMNNLTIFQMFEDINMFSNTYGKKNSSIEDLLTELQDIPVKKKSKHKKKKTTSAQIEIETEKQEVKTKQQVESETEQQLEVETQNKIIELKAKNDKLELYIKKLQREIAESFEKGKENGIKDILESLDVASKDKVRTSEKETSTDAGRDVQLKDTVRTQEKETNTEKLNSIDTRNQETSTESIDQRSPSTKTENKQVVIGDETFYFRKIEQHSLLNTLITKHHDLFEEILKKGDVHLLKNLNNPFAEEDRSENDLRQRIVDMFCKP